MKWYRQMVLPFQFVDYPVKVAADLVFLSILLIFVWLSGLFDNWNPNAWAGSLICNLFTTGLTIYFVNVAFARRDQAEARERDMNLLWLWLREVMRGTRKIRKAINGEADLAESLGTAERTGNSISNFVTTYGRALRPETVYKLEAITNSLAFLETLEPEKLEKELDGIDGLTTTLWREIRGSRTNDVP